MLPVFKSAITQWRAVSLASQFLLVSTCVTLASIVLIGQWLSYRIEDGVTKNTALATALYVESFVSPKLQSLADDDAFQPDVQQELQRLMRETVLGQRIFAYKVWKQNAQIIYASNQALIGATVQSTANLREAWSGRVAAKFDQNEHVEDRSGRRSRPTLLEVYVPIRKAYADTVIAVVEFYEEADKLKSDIFRAKLESWLILGGVGLLAVMALYGTVAGASRTIEQQRRSLEGRVAELSNLLDQNQSLRGRLERSSLRTAEINEHYLRRLGSELHDGPAQLVSLALLRFDAARKPAAPPPGRETTSSLPVNDKAMIRGALSDALNEIRNIAIGLSLPEVEQLTVGEAIKVAVKAHERRTGTKVELVVGQLPETSPHITKATCFRFVQEGLNNAANHGKGVGQRIVARSQDDTILVDIHDAGPGFDIATLESSGRLGLIGLRERLESIGGALVVASQIGSGTSLMARFPNSSGISADV